jgi:PilZ domain
VAERRKTDRQKITATVDYCSGWKREQAAVYDLSTEGCLLRSGIGFAEPGDMIMIRFDDRVSATGKVVWLDHRLAGIRFERALHPLIVDRFTHRDDKAELNHGLGRDQFGRPLVGRARKRRLLI